MPTPLPLSNPWRKTTLRYWHHLSTAWPRYLRSWWQRARDGYSAPDVWGFDTYLAQVIAGGLRQLIANNHSTPTTYYEGELETATKEDWSEASERWLADLTAAADKLDRYVSDEILSMEEETRRYAEAKEAMMWVAENFGSLWD